MRKFLIAALAASALVPTMASATDRNEVRRDQQEVRHDQRDAKQAARQGDWQKAQRAKQETREDRRELNDDWRSYRQSHRSTYQRGTWNAPRGVRYQPVSVGYRFQPAFYGSQYWVNDYARYRLPNPGYGHRWIRYGNDVILIETRSGRVLRVINAFFL